MIVLVAGGTGFLGRHVVARLQRRGHHVIVYHRGMRAVPTTADVIINCVGILRETGSQTFVEAHVEVTKWLLGLGKKLKIQQFVQVSAIGADAHGTTYQRTKAQAEALVEKSKIPYVIVRPSMIFGKEDRSVNTFRKICRTGFFPLFANGHVQPVSVSSVSEVIVLAAERRIQNSTVEVAGPETFTYKQLADRIHPGVTTFFLPKWIIQTMTWMGDRIPLSLFPTKEMVRMLKQDNTTKKNILEKMRIKNPSLR